VAAGGFTNVYSHTFTVPVDLSRPFTLPVEPGVNLDPGVYLVAWYFAPSDPRVFNLRFVGEANGHNYGRWDDAGLAWGPTSCKTGTLPDSSPAGSAVYAADQWAPPNGTSPTGPFPSTIGYLTWFRPYETKTPGCIQDPRVAGWNKKGVPVDKNGKPVSNPDGRPWGASSTGDLDMQITGAFL
jgi:hypothetical protein